MHSRLLLVLALLTASVAAHDQHGGMSISTNFDYGISCDNIEVTFRGAEGAQASQQFSIPGNATLRVRDLQNGGVAVKGWDKNEFAVSACKFAAGNTAGDAQQRLSRIQVNVSGGEISIAGPREEGNDWTVYVLIQAPRGSNLNLATHNGPIWIKDLNANVVARAVNGPVSLDNSGGRIDAAATNGPVSLKGGSGDLKLRTENGPVSVNLSGSRWDGQGLEASTVNGPLTVKVPAQYVSGVEVKGSGHSPMRCVGPFCDSAQKTWDTGYRRITLGGTSPVIRMSTVNGPVSVESRRAEN